MDFDIKAVSVVLGIASSIIALLYKIKPNPAASLKRDLELLKLAQETKASYFALQRHIDAQIIDQYIVRDLGRRRKFELYAGEIFTWIVFGIIILGFFGSLAALAARAILSIEDTTAEIITFVGAGFGLLGGTMNGVEKGSERVREAERDVELRADELAKADEAAIRRIRASDA